MRKHKFLNIRGFSLVEIMVIGGILTIIGLGVMSLISNTTKSQRGLQAKDTMRDFAVEIRSTLSDKTACINTFATKDLSTNEATVTVVKDASNNAKYSAGTTYMNGLINFKNLVMREFVADAANPNTGIAKLFVYADKNGDTSGVKTIHHVLSAQIEMDASKNILKCIAVGGLSDSLWQVSTANPNDIFFSGGKVGVGTTTPAAMVSTVTESASSIFPGFTTSYYSDSNAWANGFSGARARGTLAAPTALQTNDRFLSFIGGAYSGSYFHNSAGIQFVATENHSATGQGAAISFETIENGHPTAAGVTTRFERMRIDHSGNVGIGTTNPLSSLHITGSGPAFTGIFIEGSPVSASGICSTDSSHNIQGCIGHARAVGDFGPTDTTPGDFVISSNNNLRFSAGNSVPWTTTVTGGPTITSLSILKNGNVGINTTTPQTKLDVNGEVKLASSGSACSTSNEGALRYNSTTKSLEFCNGTIWNSTSQSPAGTFCGSVSYDHLLGHNFNPKACGTSPPTDTTTLVNNCPSGYSLFRYFQADSNYGYTCVKL